MISLDSLAREFAKASNNSYTPDTYFFGTWRIHIPEYILWASYRLGKRNTACPSWSWASCGGSAWLRFRGFDSNRPDNAFPSHCKVVSVDRDSGFLTLESKRLKISNLILPAMEYVNPADLIGNKALLPYRQPLVHGYAFSEDGKEPCGWIEFDDERDPLGGTEEVFFVHLAETYYYTKPMRQDWGLIW